jgi:uncharacterized peroxidase-related enzyme
MTYVQTVPDDQAEGDVQAMYDADRKADGSVPNYTRAFSARPGVYAAWKGLAGAVKAGMDPRRYELVSIAAARRLRCSYCVLAHGTVTLKDGYFDEETLRAVVDDHQTSGLDEVDLAIMDLADQIAADATAVTQEDVDRLRELGLSDTEIFDVVAAATMRCFFAKTLDALGARPDASFGALAPELREALTVGLPIAEA